MSIYTKFGDKGKTSLYGGKTVSKASERVKAYGSVDELNSFLGVILSELKDSPRGEAGKAIKNSLINIQKDLFEIGASLASISKNKDESLSKYLKKRTKDFEKEIDSFSKKLPQLSNFILPGGGKSGSKLHYARTIARRAERRIVALNDSDKVNPDVLVFMNRLSDLLFTYARFINKKEGKKETLWITRK